VIGRVDDSDRVRLSVEGRTIIDEPRRDLEEIWGTAIETCFERRRAIA
jgi:hypothetical protein